MMRRRLALTVVMAASALLDGAALAAPRCGEFAPPPQSNGRVWTVSPSGDDAAAGTTRAPLRTLQAAADHVRPGDTVIVEDGVYTSSSRAVVRIARGGSPDAWVWFKSRRRLGARITGAAPVARGFDIVDGAGFVRIEGFDISGLDGSSGAAGVDLETGGHDTHILRNRFRRIGRTCTNTHFGIAGVYVHARNATIEANEFADIGRLAPGEQGCAPATTYWRDHDHGIYVGASPPGVADGAVIVNNVFRDLTHGWPVHVYPGAVSDLAIGFNTFLGANPHVRGSIILAVDRLTRPRIFANVFAAPREAAIYIAGEPVTTDALIVDNVTPTAILATNGAAGVSPPGNRLGVDPRLDASGAPRRGSPAIDAAATQGVARDIRGCARPRGPRADAGAFEF